VKFLIVHYDSGRFLDYYYRIRPEVASLSYSEQVAARVGTLQIWAGLYAPNLRAMGHSVEEIFIADPVIQRAWAREHLPKQPSETTWKFRMRRGLVPWLSRVTDDRWMWDVVEAQVKHYKPDVLFNHWIVKDPGHLSGRLRPLVKLMAAQHTQPLIAGREHWKNYDLLVTAFPPYVDQFRSEGLNCRLLRLGFESSWLDKMTSPERKDIPVSFVGHLGNDFHSKRLKQLEAICCRYDLHLYSATKIDPQSAAFRSNRGEVWGAEMFDLFRRSWINLNFYPDFHNDWAINLRLYEATGAGGMLLTEWKPNLPELFEPDKEVGVYRSIDEMGEKIEWYLDHPDEADAIALAGQRRTLKDHTYRERTEELVGFVEEAMKTGR